MTESQHPRSVELKRKRPVVSTRSISSIAIDLQIGSGTYGEVFKGRDIDTGAVVALKKLKMEKETKEPEGFPITAIREIKILKALRHENIVNLREVVTSFKLGDKSSFESGDVYMVFEYLDYDLAGLMDTPGVTLSQQHIKHYMRQLLEGLHFMHKNRILHRDIKGANLLISKDHRLKIADVGLARSMGNTQRNFTNPVVTLWYRSLELLLGLRQYGPEIDMWSVGCVFAEMNLRHAILPGRTEIHQVELIYQFCGTPVESSLVSKLSKLPNWEKFKFFTPPSPEHPSGVPIIYPSKLREKFKRVEPAFSATDLIEKLLHLDPLHRISAEEALDHDYFWATDVVNPKNLAVFHVAAGHEYETKKQKEEERNQRLARQQQQQHHQHGGHHPHQHDPRNAGGGRGGRGGGSGGGKRWSAVGHAHPQPGGGGPGGGQRGGPPINYGGGASRGIHQGVNQPPPPVPPHQSHHPSQSQLTIPHRHGHGQPPHHAHHPTQTLTVNAPLSTSRGAHPSATAPSSSSTVQSTTLNQTHQHTQQDLSRFPSR